MQIPYDTARAGGRTRPAARPSFAITVGRAKAVVVVAVKGSLDTEASEQLRGVLTDLVENQGNLNVEVDLAEVTAMSTVALTVLVEAASQAGERGGQLFLRNAPQGAPEISAPQPVVFGAGPPARRLHAMAWHPAAGPSRRNPWPPAGGRGDSSQ